jgi:peptidoglycan/LPS O-acetylase OafA/YrhL
MTKIKWLSMVRITALALILVYHFFQDILPGGFIGVDVFFTLSGYLLTMSILEEFRNSGKIRLFAFYKRRFLRIYPPLVLSILFLLPFTLLVSPDFTVNIKRQAAAALGFVTNYFEILNGGSYEANLLPHLFLHTWFLAVEMHLYLLWGLSCVVIAFLMKRMYRASAGESLVLLRVLLCMVSVAGALLSYLKMQMVYDYAVFDPSAAYFDTGSRAFPFLLGAGAGSVFYSSTVKAKKSKIVSILQGFLLICGMAALIGGLAVLAKVLYFSGKETYRFGFAAVSILTILIIQAARGLHGLTPNIREPRLLTAAAGLSYNLYLFHWPLYVVFFYCLPDNVLAVTATMAVSVIFSILVHFGLEPLFNRNPARTIPLSAPRRLFYRAVLLPLLAAAALNGFVFARSPEINSLETQLYTGYLYQDVDHIISLQRLTETINNKPLIPPGTLPLTDRFNNGPAVPADNSAAGAVALPVSYDNGILPGVTIVGDSVCLGARKKLMESILNCTVDAAGSRQMWQGYDLLMQMQNSNSLREYIVIALGTNQRSDSIEKIDKIIANIKSGHRLIFVTPYNGAMKETWMTYKIIQYERALPAVYPFVTVADWASVIKNQHQLLGVDKIHIGGMQTAINLYTNCIIEAINTAAMKPAKE